MHVYIEDIGKHTGEEVTITDLGHLLDYPVDMLSIVIVGNSATIRVGTEDHPVAPGSAVFVPAGTEHHFHSITAELQVLVVFAPAETAITT